MDSTINQEDINANDSDKKRAIIAQKQTNSTDVNYLNTDDIHKIVDEFQNFVLLSIILTNPLGSKAF